MTRWYAHVDGKQYGPVSEQELRQWYQQQRINPTDMVWAEGTPDWLPAAVALGPASTATPVPPPVPAAAVGLQPHRGMVILILGILGLVMCGVVGIFAWVMGNEDLRKMNDGIMDPAGRDMTKAGRICGMIATILMIVTAAVVMVALIVGVAFGA